MIFIRRKFEGALKVKSDETHAGRTGNPSDRLPVRPVLITDLPVRSGGY